MSKSNPKKINYRFTTFAERLGPHSARNIVCHYIGMMTMVYVTLIMRNNVMEISEKCPIDGEDPDFSEKYKGLFGESSSKYWTDIICNISMSSNITVIGFRKYMDFAAYYVSIAVAILITVVMIVMAKHLYKAFFLEPKPKKKKGGRKGSNQEEDEDQDNSVVICAEDSFWIEVILAAFDFFRVADTKRA